MNACHRPYISWPSPGSLCPRCPLVGVTLFYSLTSEAHPASLPQRVAPTSQLDAAADQPSRVSCLYMATCHLQGTRHASGPCELPPPPPIPTPALCFVCQAWPDLPPFPRMASWKRSSRRNTSRNKAGRTVVVRPSLLDNPTWRPVVEPDPYALKPWVAPTASGPLQSRLARDGPAPRQHSPGLSPAPTAAGAP